MKSAREKKREKKKWFDTTSSWPRCLKRLTPLFVLSAAILDFFFYSWEMVSVVCYCYYYYYYCWADSVCLFACILFIYLFFYSIQIESGQGRIEFIFVGLLKFKLKINAINLSNFENYVMMWMIRWEIIDGENRRKKNRTNEIPHRE